MNVQVPITRILKDRYSKLLMLWLLVLMFSFLSLVSLIGQGFEVTILGGDCNGNSSILDFNGVINGKNSYSTMLDNPPGGTATLFWSVMNNRWELIIEGSDFDPLNGLNYYNPLNTCFEPPCSGWIFGAEDDHPCFPGFMDLQLDGVGNGLAPECEEAECPPPPIPTLSQWGFIVLMLSFMIFAIVKIRKGKLVLNV